MSYRAAGRARSTGGPGTAIAGRFKSVTPPLCLSAHPTPPAAQIRSAASSPVRALSRTVLLFCARLSCPHSRPVPRPLPAGCTPNKHIALPSSHALFCCRTRCLPAVHLSQPSPIQRCGGWLVRHSRRMREGEREREMSTSLIHVAVVLLRLDINAQGGSRAACAPFGCHHGHSTVG